MNTRLSSGSHKSLVSAGFRAAMRFGRPLEASKDPYIHGFDGDEVIGKEAELTLRHLGRNCLLIVTAYDEKVGNTENQSLVEDSEGAPLVRIMVHTDEKLPVLDDNFDIVSTTYDAGIHGVIDIPHLPAAYYDFDLEFLPEVGRSTMGVPPQADSVDPFAGALGFRPADILISDYDAGDFVEKQRGTYDDARARVLASTLETFVFANSASIDI